MISDWRFGRQVGVLAALLLVPQASSVVAQPQARPRQADAVVQVLGDIEDALSSGRRDAFEALLSPAVPPAVADPFDRFLQAGRPTSAAVRERSRRPLPSGAFEVLADVLVSRTRLGRLATWQIVAQPRADAPDRLEITALEEVAAIDGLLRLSLDTTQQYAVHDLVISAPDLTLKMSSGSAFVAQAGSGITAIVLRGSGHLRFAPPDPAEQGQLRIFNSKPDLDTSIDSAFIRLSPADVQAHVTMQSLVPAQVEGDDVKRAQEVFDEFAPRTFGLSLGDLSPERWSFEPSADSIVVEFKAKKQGWLTYVRSPGAVEDISVFDREHSRNISVYMSADHAANRGPFYDEDDDQPYDIEHYALDLSFEPERPWISGRATVQLVTRQDGLANLTLRLADGLDVSSVSSAQLGRLLALRIIGQNKFLVSLPRRMPAGTTLTFDITYSGPLPPQSLDREAMAPEGQAPAAGGQDIDPFVLVPEPRYLYSNRVFWYPQGEVTDFATATMRLSVPSEYQMVASGSLVGSTLTPVPSGEPGGEPRYVRTLSYAADRPARYLSCVISRFVAVGQGRTPVPHLAPSQDATASAPEGPASVDLEVVSTPRQTRKNRDLSDRLGDMMRFYADFVGEAPYPHFTVAAIDDNLPGGHSPAYFAVLHQPLPTTPYVWQSDPVAFDNYPWFFLAHELAHQWWGQAVGWKNYHEQWLSEGLAQYFATLYTASSRGPEPMHDLLVRMRESAETYSSQGPVHLGYRLGHIQSNGRVFRALVYNKSAVVLHMLRRLIGDGAFQAGIRQFYREWRFRKAATNDLQAAFEQAAGRPLDVFFQPWIMGSSLPHVRLATSVAPDGATLVVRTQQAGGTFAFPLTVTIEYKDAASEDVTLSVWEAAAEHRIPLHGEFKKLSPHEDLTPVRIEK